MNETTGVVDTSTMETVSKTIFYCTGMIGMVANVVLLYLIFRKSPPSLRIYRVLLANTALADLVFSFSITVAQIRIIPIKGYFFYVPLGPASYFGADFGYEMYTLQLHSIFYTFLSFPLSFGFRYWILMHPMPKQSTLLWMCTTMFGITTLQHTLFHYSQMWDQAEILKLLSVFRPQYDLSGYQVSGNLEMFENPRVMIVLFTITLPMFPIYGGIIMLYVKTKSFLKNNNSNFRKTTIRRHTRLLNALVVQASIPVITVFPPIVLYAMYHMEIWTSTWIEYAIYPFFSFYPALCPIVTITYVRPYYSAIVRFVTRRNPFWSSQYRKANNKPCLTGSSFEGSETNRAVVPI